MTSSSDYMVVVFNLTRGWTMSATSDSLSGTTEDLPNLRRVLCSPFIARWGFKDGLIPNPMDPERVTLNMWARTVADENVVDLGDVINVTVYLNDTDARFLYGTTGRVTAAESDLVPTDPWAVRTKVELTGFTADIAAANIGVNEVITVWRQGWMRAEVASGHAFILPSPAPSVTDAMDSSPLNGQPVAKLAERLIHSAAPFGVAFSYIADYTTGDPNASPAGYTRAANLWNPGDGSTLVSADPVRYIVTPASRRESVAFAAPLQFVVRDGLVTVSSTPGTTSPSRNPAVSARWCRIPTNVRRTRDHIVNNLRFKGQAKSNTTTNHRSTEVNVTNVADAAARGLVTREVETALRLRDWDEATGTESAPYAAVINVGGTYLSDASVLASTRAYEALDLYPHLMPPAEAYNVLPYLAPHIPGRVQNPTSDGRLLRHVTVYAVDEGLSSPSLVPGGFITGVELSIDRGVLRYRLTTTPGQPIYGGTAPTPMSVGAFIVKTFATSTLYNNTKVDPTIRVGDLDQIGA